LTLALFIQLNKANGQCKSSYVNIGELNTQGPFGAQTVTFQKSNLPCHDSVFFQLLLDVSKSWDGNGNHCCGPDIFQVVADNIIVFQTTFSLTGGYGNRQSYPAQYNKSNMVNYPQGTGKVGGGSGWDRYLLKFSFPHSANDIKIQVAQPASQGVADEAWYLNNLSVSIKTCKGSISIAKNFSLCSNDTINYRGKKYYSSGVFYDTAKTNDCDSIFTINVIKKAKPIGKITAPPNICQNDTNQIVEFFSADSSEAYIYTYRLNSESLQTINGDVNNRAAISIP